MKLGFGNRGFVPGILLLGVLGAGGCTVGPDFEPPNMIVPDAYMTASSGQLLAASSGAEGDLPWWRGFNDTRLSALVEAALDDNLDIAAARERLLQARALVTVAASDGAPALAAQTGVESAGRLAGGGEDAQDPSGEIFSAALFSWVPDLFGGRARSVEAAEAELRRQAFLRADLARLTAADIARRFVEIRRDAEQLRLVDFSLGLQQQTFDLVRTRFDAGLAAQLDMTRARADLAATRAQRPELIQSMEAAGNAIAVLAGAMPGAIATGALREGDIPVFAGGPDAGVPRDMVRRRPDVSAAEAALASQTARIGVAEADLYPMLSLPGRISLNLEGLGTGNIVEGIVASIAATLDLALFDGGARRAQVSVAEARTREALLLYRRTVLVALGEVETALAAVVTAQDRRALLAEAVAANEQAFEQAEDLYSQGLAGFIEVLDAQRNLFLNYQELARAKADLALAFIDLHAATGAPVAANEA